MNDCPFGSCGLNELADMPDAGGWELILDLCWALCPPRKDPREGPSRRREISVAERQSDARN